MQKCDYPTRWSKPHWRILCYHDIADHFVGNFRAQLTAFGEMGFSFVDLDSGLKLCRGEGFTNPLMTVTFDDGDLTVYKNALPILQDLGIRGFLYLIADYVNGGKAYHSKNLLPAMTWDHVRDWMGMGHGVGSHTLTHAPLRFCSDSRLLEECALSRQMLQNSLQVSISHLSYPFGEHSRRTHRLIKAARLYESAATIDRGRMWAGHDRYILRRDVCDPSTPVASLVRVMQLADRWYWLRYFRRYWSRSCRQMRKSWKERRLAGEWEAVSEENGKSGLSGETFQYESPDEGQDGSRSEHSVHDGL